MEGETEANRGKRGNLGRINRQIDLNRENKSEKGVKKNRESVGTKRESGERGIDRGEQRRDKEEKINMNGRAPKENEGYGEG